MADIGNLIGFLEPTNHPRTTRTLLRFPVPTLIAKCITTGITGLTTYYNAETYFNIYPCLLAAQAGII